MVCNDDVSSILREQLMNGYTLGTLIAKLARIAGKKSGYCLIMLVATLQLSDAHSQSYPVGFQLLETADHSRMVTAGVKPTRTHARPMRIYLWYPASVFENEQLMRFGRYAELAEDDIWPEAIAGDLRKRLRYSRRPLARSLGQKRFDELKRKTVTAVEGAAALEGPFPLIVMGQGLYYESPVVFAALAEQLASHGFVVATCPLAGTNSPIVTMDVSGLETQVRDLEFTIAEVRERSFVSAKDLGVFGFDMGGMAGLILSMRNPDVDAFVSVSSGVLYSNPSSIPAASPDYDPAALRVPWLHSVPSSWIRQPEGSDDKTLFDLAQYSERYLLLTELMEHVDYTSYALIEDRPAMEEYWNAGKAGDRDRYAAVARYIMSFYAAYLKHDADALTALSVDPAAAVEGAAMTLEHRRAAPAAITYEQFVQAAVAGGADAAIDELRELQDTQPDHALLKEAYLNRLTYSLRGTWRLDEEILPLLEFTVELFPSSENALYALAEGHITLDNYPAAIELYERLLEIDPNDEQNYIKRRLVWLHSK